MYTAQWYLALEFQIVITVIAFILGKIVFKVSWHGMLIAGLLCFSVPVATPPGFETFLLPADFALPILFILAIVTPKASDRRLVWAFAVALLLWPIFGTLLHAATTAIGKGWITFLYRRLLLVCLFYLGATGRFKKAKGIDIVHGVMIIWTGMAIIGVFQGFGLVDVDFAVRTAGWMDRGSILETTATAQRGFLGLDRGAVGTYGAGMIAIAASLFFFEPKLSKFELILYFSCIVLSGLVIFLSGSRTGLLAAGGGLAYVTFVSLKSLGRARIARVVAAAVFVMPIVIYKFADVLSVSLETRVSSEGLVAESLEGRLGRQFNTLNHAVFNFRGAVFGFGGASLGYTESVLGLSKPHNEYMQHLQEGGWIGLFSYLFLMLIIFRRLSPRVGPDLAVYGVVGRAALLSGMICGLSTAFLTFTSENRIIYAMVIAFILGRLCFEMQGYRQQYQNELPATPQLDAA